MARDKIKRSFLWLRKTLDIIDKTTLPGEILGEVRPTLDMFGWERLPEEQIIFVAGTAVSIKVSTSPPAGTVRLVLHCSLAPTGTGVGLTAILRKRNPAGTASVGLPTDRDAIEDDEVASMIGHTFLTEGEVIVGEYVNPPVGGVSTLTLSVIDLPVGEYIPPI